MFQTLRTVINCGADINVVDEMGLTPLMIAVKKRKDHIADGIKREGIMEELLCHSPNIHICDHNCDNAILLAAYNGDSAAIKRLFIKGADI